MAAPGRSSPHPASRLLTKPRMEASDDLATCSSLWGGGTRLPRPGPRGVNGGAGNLHAPARFPADQTRFFGWTHALAPPECLMIRIRDQGVVRGSRSHTCVDSFARGGTVRYRRLRTVRRREAQTLSPSGYRLERHENVLSAAHRTSTPGITESKIA